MRGVNKVFLLGHLGKDPETKSFANGGSLTSASLATSERWTDKEGQKQERTEWHNLVFNGPLSDVAAKYLTKGSKVFIEGQIRTRKWQDKEGKDRYTTEINVREMQMLDGKPADGGRRDEPRQAQQRSQPQPAQGHQGGGASRTTTSPSHHATTRSGEPIPHTGVIAA